MLELHGWITLRESYKANDEEKNMKHIFGKIKTTKVSDYLLKVRILL